MSGSLVSIIVPIYNVEKFLGKCIQSIIDQSYRNIEIILIDDGSLDRSNTICDEFADKDSRVRVIHKENKGVSDARNTGIEISRGDYISFVDGDDWLAPDFVDYMLKGINLTESEIFISTNCFTTRNYSQINTDKIEIWSSEKTFINFLTFKVSIGCWNKIYRRDFIDKFKLRFKCCLYMGEGLHFITTASQVATQIGVGHRKIYYYRLNNQNSAVSKFDYSKAVNALSAIELIKNEIKLESSDAIEAIDLHIWENIFFIIRSMIGTNIIRNNHELYLQHASFLRKNGLRFFLFSKATLKFRIRVPFIMFSPYLAGLLLNMRLKSARLKDKSE